MDKITQDVTKVQSDLHGSRSQLRVLERTSKKDIASKVDAIRPPLASGQKLLGSICSSNASFIARIEDNKVDLGSPYSFAVAEMPRKLSTLRTELDQLVSHLESAQSATATAIQTTDSYTLKVIDVGQDIDVGSAKLKQCQNSAATLQAQAQRDLADTKAALKRAETELAEKRTTVRAKEREVQQQRERKRKVEEEIREKNSQVAAAERERNERKEQAAVSGVSSTFYP